MPSLVFPEITWSGGNHTLTFGVPVSNAKSFAFHEATESRVPGTGIQDAWTDGVFQRAEFDAKWIPIDGTATDNGWHTPSPGFRAWLEHQRQNPEDHFTFKPDKDGGTTHTCRLIRAEEDKEESGLHYRIHMIIEDVDNSAFTDY